jgi:ectoine hydroxylase-related dioxygenase (phytanoyl-CoA dioxygenase family)
MDELAYALRTAGYVKLEGALEPARVDALRTALDAMSAEDDAAWGTSFLDSIGQRGALRNLCDHSEPFQKLLADSPVYPLIDELLETPYVLHSYDGLVLFPGQGRFPWDFHTDVTPLADVAFPANRTPGINCLYYLDDAGRENGATWLVPASHRATVRSAPPEELAELAEQIAGHAGDALLFDARLWHCAGENRSARPRRLVKMLFCQPWLRPQMDYSRAVRPEIQARLDPRARRLLGVGVAPPASVRELREALAR